MKKSRSLKCKLQKQHRKGELVSQSDGDDIWTETYTYVSDTNTPHAFAETVEKQGDWYAMKDVEYQVTELTTQLIQKAKQCGHMHRMSRSRK